MYFGAACVIYGRALSFPIMNRVLVLALLVAACGGGTAASTHELAEGGAGGTPAVAGASHGGSAVKHSGGSGSMSVTAPAGAGGIVDVSPSISGAAGESTGGATVVITPGGEAGAAGALAGGAGGGGGADSEEPPTVAGAGGEAPQVESWKVCDGGKICASDEVCAHDSPTTRICTKINDQFGRCDPTTLPNPNTDAATYCEGKSNACSQLYFKCGMMDDPATGKGCGMVTAQVPAGSRWYCGPPL